MIDFLVVEDNDIKFENIKNTILSIRTNFHIERAGCVEHAIDLIKKRRYSFVLIDIQLPNASYDTELNKSAGIELIGWIKHNQKNSKCQPPENILIISEFQDLIEKYKTDFLKTRVFSYLYNQDNDWQTDIKDCIEEYLLRNSYLVSKTDEETILYSVHGINTYGEWQTDLDNYISQKNDLNLVHTKYSYHFYPVYSFLIPILRKREVKRLIKDLEHCARRAPLAKVHLIGHSFGTYLICKALSEIPVESAPKIGNVIFVNSVLKSSFSFTKIIKKFSNIKILNECGINDRVLILSQAAALGLGMAGRMGLKGKLYDTITNRFFEGGHSDLFSEKLFSDWINFLSDNQAPSVDQRSKANNYTAVKNSILIALPYLIFIIAFSTFYYY